MTTRVSPAGPESAPRPSASNDAERDVEPGAEAEHDEQDGDRLEDRRRGPPPASVRGRPGTSGASPRPDRRRRGRPHRAGTRAAPRRARPPARTRRARCPSRDRAGPRRPRSTRLWAMPTGMPTMTPATTTRQKTARDRCSAARTVIGRRPAARRGWPPPSPGSRSRRRGRRSRPGVTSSPYQKPAPPASRRSMSCRVVWIETTSSAKVASASGPTVPSTTAPM